MLLYLTLIEILSLADYQEVGVMNAAHTVANAPEKLHQCWLINYLNMCVNLREACAKDI